MFISLGQKLFLRLTLRNKSINSHKIINNYYHFSTMQSQSTNARTALDEVSQKGAFVRKESAYRNWISEESDRFKPESERYHLYISYACPWAHRTLITRNLKGLQDHIGLSIVHPTWEKTRPDKDDHAGWVFRSEKDEPMKSVLGFGSFPCKDVIPDTVNNCKSVREIYELSKDTNGKYSVPVLWDKKEKVIVNNESAEIVRMFNSAFNKLSKNPELDLYPEHLRSKIDEINDYIYDNFNNGVYKAGFAKSQEAYDEAVVKVFEVLDKTEEILSKSRYLVGNQLTEADIRFFVTLVRFDEVYVVYFKCNKKRIIDYPNLLNYTRDLYQNQLIGDTVNMYHIKTHYYTSHPIQNHYAIVPIGADFMSTLKEKHDRDRFTS